MVDDQALNDDWVDGVISTLIAAKNKKAGTNVNLSPNDVMQLCNTAKDILLSQPMLLELGAPIKICGDIHGQYNDLLRLFEYGGFPPEVSSQKLFEGFFIVIAVKCKAYSDHATHPSFCYIPVQSNYLFLGDYVDRGKQSIEVICLLFAYKIKYPENFFILRGNHEASGINRIYGFYDECRRRYSVKIWKTFCNAFECLPCTAVVDDKIICMHGGLSPELQKLDQIQNINRPCDVPDTGLLCDLLWSDPDASSQVSAIKCAYVLFDCSFVQSLTHSIFVHHQTYQHNDRGVSYTFGPRVVSDFLRKHDLDLVVRAHQVVEDGYEFFAGRELVTVFSAPNYCGEFDNAGAMMTVDETLMCSFQILKPATDQQRRY